MSGIVGLLNLDGPPVDHALLLRLTDAMAFRGPDAQVVWCDGPVGFGHAMLRTTTEAARERQPCTLDGNVWIVADARVDARPELRRRLEVAGCTGIADATDPELILHAWHVWGESCVELLLGDFAFAIWDRRRRCLFCARDQFGVKPFYFSRAGHTVVFGNTLDCIRLHPDVPSDLNELAVADFLTFGWNQDPAATLFQGIQSLPAAHTLAVQGGKERVSRYWRLPDEDVRDRDGGEYVEQFLEVFETAVADRLRNDRVAVFMSGALDSPSVAAMACSLMQPLTEERSLRAFTAVGDRLAPDEGQRWSGLIARHLGIPIDYLPLNGYELLQQAHEPNTRLPEPMADPLWARALDLFRLAAQDHQVALTGEGGDACLWPTRGTQAGADERPLPEWLSEDFVARGRLRGRWEETRTHRAPVGAREAVLFPFWPAALFPSYDPGLSRQPLECRHPFFDLRLVSFFLSVPPFPWLHRKELLRVAMAGRLPQSVRRRQPSASSTDSLARRLRTADPATLLPERAQAQLAPFVRFDALRAALALACAGTDDATARELLRPVCLAHWLADEAAAVNQVAVTF